LHEHDAVLMSDRKAIQAEALEGSPEEVIEVFGNANRLLGGQ